MVELKLAGCWVQAFAWYSDLMVEHSEIFWSLFAVDMDAVLELQPPDTWDSFPLFQNLNDYLRVHGTVAARSQRPLIGPDRSRECWLAY